MTAPGRPLRARRAPGGTEPLAFPGAAARGRRSHGRPGPDRDPAAAAAAARAQVGTVPRPVSRAPPRAGLLPTSALGHYFPDVARRSFLFLYFLLPRGKKWGEAILSVITSVKSRNSTKARERRQKPAPGVRGGAGGGSRRDFYKVPKLKTRTVWKAWRLGRCIKHFCF